MTLYRPFQKVEGVGGRAGEGVLVEDLFSEGADEGLAVELAAAIFFGTLDNVVDMEGAFCGYEYVIYNIHIRLTFSFWG